MCVSADMILYYIILQRLTVILHKLTNLCKNHKDDLYPVPCLIFHKETFKKNQEIRKPGMLVLSSQHNFSLRSNGFLMQMKI
jgi:hypothetical protein